MELTENGKKMGSKTMQRYGHIEWAANYAPGKIKAVGYRNGRKRTRTIETTGKAAKAIVERSDKGKSTSDHVVVADISLADSKGRMVPDACNKITITIEGDAQIIGFGNGDPAWQSPEQPMGTDKRTIEMNAFNGKAQVIIDNPKQQHFNIGVKVWM